ncbi:MAG TPA: hypothetical protein VLK29_07480 [Luteimonas sp.]|nr:hypothetical protein [Luteimonas sp.]
MTSEAALPSAGALRGARLMVGTPMHDGQACALYVAALCALTRLCLLQGVVLRTCFLTLDSSISRARSRIVREFLDSDCQHLLFIDADVGFDAADALALLALAAGDGPYDVVAAAHPRKHIDWARVADRARTAADAASLQAAGLGFAWNPLDADAVPDGSRPIEIAEAGTGFMLIRRALFARLDDAHPELAFETDLDVDPTSGRPRPMRLYFASDIDPDTRRYRSGDYAFSRRARAAGARIWLCPWMSLRHVGPYVFEGRVAAVAR